LSATEFLPGRASTMPLTLRGENKLADPLLCTACFARNAQHDAVKRTCNDNCIMKSASGHKTKDKPPEHETTREKHNHSEPYLFKSRKPLFGMAIRADRSVTEPCEHCGTLQD